MSDYPEYDERQKNLRTRNPYGSLKEYPITKDMIREFEMGMRNIWEDTRVVTAPNGINLGITVGNLRKICYLAEKKAPK